MSKQILEGPTLREMLADSGCEERALVRMMLRFVEGRGCSLSADDVERVIGNDHALHQRIINEYNRMNGLGAD